MYITEDLVIEVVAVFLSAVNKKKEKIMPIKFHEGSKTSTFITNI